MIDKDKIITHAFDELNGFYWDDKEIRKYKDEEKGRKDIPKGYHFE